MSIFESHQIYNLIYSHCGRVEKLEATFHFYFEYGQDLEKNRKYINIHYSFPGSSMTDMTSFSIHFILPLKHTTAFICSISSLDKPNSDLGVLGCCTNRIMIIDTVAKTLFVTSYKALEIEHKNSIARIVLPINEFQKTVIIPITWNSKSDSDAVIQYYLNNSQGNFELYEIKIFILDNTYYSLLYDNKIYFKNEKHVIAAPKIITHPKNPYFGRILDVDYFEELTQCSLKEHLYVTDEICNISYDCRSELTCYNSLPYVNSRQISFDSVELELLYPYSAYKTIVKTAKFGFTWVPKQVWRAFKFAEIGALDVGFMFK